MPPKEKAAKIKLPDIAWSAEDFRLVWAFLTEIEREENRKVLFGKKDASENTSGETKHTVFKQIGEKLLPELFAQDAGTVADRLKSKLDGLTKAYQKQRARLQQTGGGVRDDEGGEQEHEEMSFYVPADGPNETTPGEAVNLWNKIKQEFPFFPRLHRIFAARPNVTPIVITTALGPQGRKKTWYQDPEDPSENENSRPSESVNAAGGDAPAPPLSPSTPNRVPAAPGRSFGTEITATITSNSNTKPSTPQVMPAPTQCQKPPRAPKASSVSRAAIETARTNIKKVPVKRSLYDVMSDMQEQLSNHHAQELTDHRMKDMCELLLRELQAGVWTVDEYREKIRELMEESVHHPAVKRARISEPEPAISSSPVRQGSPDWDLSNFYDEA